MEFLTEMKPEADKNRPAEVRCLLCGNIWLTALQPVCDCCGCASYQSVDGGAK